METNQRLKETPSTQQGKKGRQKESSGGNEREGKTQFLCHASKRRERLQRKSETLHSVSHTSTKSSLSTPTFKSSHTSRTLHFPIPNSMIFCSFVVFSF